MLNSGQAKFCVRCVPSDLGLDGHQTSAWPSRKSRTVLWKPIVPPCSNR